MNEKPLSNENFEQPKWQGEIISYFPALQDEVFAFGEKMWRDLGREWNPETKQKDLVDIAGIYQHDGGDFFLAKDEQGVVGCTGLKPLDDKTLELTRYYVLFEMHGKGIGKELLHRAIPHAILNKKKSIVLDTDSQKALKAIELFKAVRFKETNAYKDTPFSDLFMELDLENYVCPFCNQSEA